MSSKGPHVKSWVLRLALLRGGGMFKRWDLVEGSWGPSLEGDIGMPVSSSLSLLPRLYEVNSFVPLQDSHHNALRCHWLKSNGPNNHELKPPKLWSKINLSSFKLIISGLFVAAMESWLTQFIIERKFIKNLPFLFPLQVLPGEAIYSHRS